MDITYKGPVGATRYIERAVNYFTVNNQEKVKWKSAGSAGILRVETGDAVYMFTPYKAKSGITVKCYEESEG